MTILSEQGLRLFAGSDVIDARRPGRVFFQRSQVKTVVAQNLLPTSPQIGPIGLVDHFFQGQSLSTVRVRSKASLEMLSPEHWCGRWLWSSQTGRRPVLAHVGILSKWCPQAAIYLRSAFLSCKAIKLFQFVCFPIYLSFFLSWYKKKKSKIRTQIWLSPEGTVFVVNTRTSSWSESIRVQSSGAKVSISNSFGGQSGSVSFSFSTDCGAHLFGSVWTINRTCPKRTIIKFIFDNLFV